VWKFFDGDCTKASNTPYNSAQTGEVYGTTSRCFPSNAVSNQYNAQSGPDARCYETVCAENKRLYVKVGPMWYQCPVNGGTITSLYKFTGSITCPKYYLVCDSTAILQPIPPLNYTSVTVVTGGDSSGNSGNNSTTVSCFGIAATNATAVCSAHGTCVNTNKCNCNSGWTGDSCDTSSLILLGINGGSSPNAFYFNSSAIVTSCIVMFLMVLIVL